MPCPTTVTLRHAPQTLESASQPIPLNIWLPIVVLTIAATSFLLSLYVKRQAELTTAREDSQFEGVSDGQITPEAYLCRSETSSVSARDKSKVRFWDRATWEAAC
jgi:hypothetical protein